MISKEKKDIEEFDRSNQPEDTEEIEEAILPKATRQHKKFGLEFFRNWQEEDFATDFSHTRLI